ncbi:MAG: ATP-binding protein [Sphaerochaeta sp.]|nr:ATP-binding protein [Sphaerochaeta sp.]
MVAYIRVGNESIVAPDYVLNELILKGSNRSFDAMITDDRKSDYSFTLLEATYLEKTGIHFEPSDYISFGLAVNTGLLTNAGRLMADQYIVRNSRIFCTRWNGLERGSIFDDALDDKEHEGNLITLLRNSSDFVRNNSKVRFVKEAQYRIDKPDYAERAVFEAIVNALIHRDYILVGREIHIDMYDDRLEIQSPGGMYDGRAIQDCEISTIGSARRNPVIADLFHRMKFMERRGSGLTKILSESAKLPGYTEQMEPEFFSTPSDFRVVLKNMNYSSSGHTVQDTAQDNQQDNQQDSVQEMILQYCAVPRGKKEITAHSGYKDMRHFSANFLKPLIESGKLQMTIPDKPNSRNQKYVATSAT